MTSIPWRRVGGFAVLPAISALTPLLILPGLTDALGAHGWGAIALGQAIGVFASVIIGYGWGTVGPPMVARAEEAESILILRQSIASRLVVALPVLAAAGAAAYSLAPESYAGPSALAALGTALWGMSPTWYMIGRGSPKQVALFDTMPKFVAAATSAVLIARWPSAYIYPAAIFFTSTLAATTSAVRYAGWIGLAWFRGCAHHLRSQFPLVASRIVGSGFTSMSLTLVSLVAANSVPLYAASDRFRTFGALGVAAVSNGFQGWIVEEGMNRYRARARAAILITLTSGVAACLAIAFGLPLADGFIFSGAIAVPLSVSVLTGIGVALIAAGNTLSYHVLAPLSRGRGIATSAMVGGAVGVPAVLALSAVQGAVGAAFGIVIAEGAVVASLSAFAWPAWRRSHTVASR